MENNLRMHISYETHSYHFNKIFNPFAYFYIAKYNLRFCIILM